MACEWPYFRTRDIAHGTRGRQNQPSQTREPAHRSTQQKAGARSRAGNQTTSWSTVYLRTRHNIPTHGQIQASRHTHDARVGKPNAHLGRPIPSTCQRMLVLPWMMLSNSLLFPPCCERTVDHSGRRCTCLQCTLDRLICAHTFVHSLMSATADGKVSSVDGKDEPRSGVKQASHALLVSGCQQA